MSMKLSEQFVFDKIAETGGMSEIDEAVESIIEYKHTDFFERKNMNLQAWEINYRNVYAFVISVFTATLLNEYLTYQAIVGMVNHKIKIDNEIGRIEVTADLIGLISKTGLIEIDRNQSGYHWVYTEYEFHYEIPQEDKHTAITLRPQPVEENWHEGRSIFLGHSMNHHEEYARLSHLERCGQVAFKLNADFIQTFEEQPKNKPETQEQIDQWEQFKTESKKKYQELIEQDQRFFIRYGYCYRGRSYAGSYHLSPQGTSYKKAAIDLAHKEIVEGF